MLNCSQYGASRLKYSGDVVVYAGTAISQLYIYISALFWTTPTVFSNATLTRNLTE